MPLNGIEKGQIIKGNIMELLYETESNGTKMKNIK